MIDFCFGKIFQLKKCFPVTIIWVNRAAALLSLFVKGGNRGTEKWCTLPRVTQLVGSGARA